jgi:hypothetical protein
VKIKALKEKQIKEKEERRLVAVEEEWKETKKI